MTKRADGTPIVLIHGGTFTASCWDRLIGQIEGPVLAVDLPGRGAHPAPLESVTIAGAAASVAADVNGAGFDEVVLVGHSMAGCLIPAIMEILADRVQHVVFIACTVPEHGTSCLDSLPPEVHEAPDENGTVEVGSDHARSWFGNDLDDDQFAWCLSQMVPEAPGLMTEPIDLTPLQSPTPRTWVRTMRDMVVEPNRQLRFARNGGDVTMVDLDAGHMCMISQPARLAAILNSIAAT